MGDSELAPSTTPDSSMPPYNSAAGDVLGTPAQGPLPPSAAAPQDQLQPGSVQDQGQSPNLQTTPASQDPEMVIGGAHHDALVQHLLSAAHAISNTLGGSETYKVTTDAKGNPQIAKTDSTEGEKWGRIALGILGGAAKGFAAGQGPGGAAKAVSAGFDQGKQVQQEQQQAAEHDVDQKQKQMIFAANMARLNQQIVQGAWNNDHLSRDDMQKQEQVALEHEKELQDLGIQPIMTGVKDGKTLAKYGIANPNAVAMHMGKDGAMVYSEPDGQGGANLYTMTADQTNSPTTTDDQWEQYSLDPTDPTKTIKKPGSTKAGEKVGARAARRMGLLAANDAVIKTAYQNKIDQQKADTEKTKATNQAPLIVAQTREANAKAAESQANATAVKAATNYVPGQDPVLDDTAEGLASGRYQTSDVPKRTGKGQVTPQQQYAAANVVSQQKYGLPYNPTIIAQENTFAKDKKTQAYLEGIDRMTGAHGDPGQLNQLLTLAQQAGIGQNDDAPLNRVRQTIKSKLGDKAANNFDTLLSETQSNLGTLIGNPLLGSGESDLKLRTAKDAFGANPTLGSLKGQIDTVTDVLKRSRNNMAANNRYIQQRYGDQLSPGRGTGAAATAFTAAQKQPPNPPFAGAVFGTGPSGTGWYPGGGK